MDPKIANGRTVGFKYESVRIIPNSDGMFGEMDD
jgi:hypothetical protein